MPGKSLTPALAEDVTVKRESMYFHHMTNKALRVGDWKIVCAGEDKPWELYNMRGDRCESDDYASRKPEKVREMAKIWQQCEDDNRRDAGDDKP